MTKFALDSLDLAALLSSRVCHDVISPVGAIVNGLESLEEEKDAEMRGHALALIKSSAEEASARLQFCRLAFGAAGLRARPSTPATRACRAPTGSPTNAPARLERAARAHGEEQVKLCLICA